MLRTSSLGPSALPLSAEAHPGLWAKSSVTQEPRSHPLPTSTITTDLPAITMLHVKVPRSPGRRLEKLAL